MKYLKPFEIFESGDYERLKDILDKTASALDRMKSVAQQVNRKSTIGDKSHKLNDEYEQMFYDLIDDGWKYFREGEQFYSKIFLKKTIERNDDVAKKELDNIVKEMNSIKNRFTAEGFNCHYMIWFDGMPQQDNNPKTYKNDLYNYKGIGDKDWLKYSDEWRDKPEIERKKYFEAKIEFAYI